MEEQSGDGPVRIVPKRKRGSSSSVTREGKTGSKYWRVGGRAGEESGTKGGHREGGGG